MTPTDQHMTEHLEDTLREAMMAEAKDIAERLRAMPSWCDKLYTRPKHRSRLIPEDISQKEWAVRITGLMRGKPDQSAHDLAQQYGISYKTMDDYLRKLRRAGLVEISGHRKSDTNPKATRPHAVYRLS